MQNGSVLTSYEELQREMESPITIDQITRELIDGLDLNFNETKCRLLTFLAANQMSLQELRDWCWEDSVAVFDVI